MVKKINSFFEKEHWYVTNIDHIVKSQIVTGHLLITIIHDKTEHSFVLLDTKQHQLIIEQQD